MSRATYRLPMQSLPLLLFHGAALCAVAFGHPYDERNRNAGLVSIAVSLLLCLLVITSQERRRHVASAVAIGGLAAAAVAFSAIDPTTVDIGGQKAWLAQPIANAWPHLSDRSVLAIDDRLGFVPVRMTPNTVAFLSLGIPIVALSAFTVSGAWWRRAGWALVAVLGSLIVIGTGSRGSTAGLFAGAAVLVAIVISANSRVRLTLGLAAYLIALLLSIALAQSDPTLSGRAALWATAVEQIKSALLLGSYGAFANDFPVHTNAHNVLIQTALDLGLAGVAAICLAAFTSLVIAARILGDEARARRSVVGVQMARLTVSYLAAVTIAGFVDSMLTMPLHMESELVTVLTPLIPMALAAPLALPRSSGRARILEHVPAGLPQGRS